MAETPTSCSFCGRARNEVRALIMGTDDRGAICDKCVVEANQQLAVQASKSKKVAAEEAPPLPTPRELVALLDEYVVGQDLAKQNVAAGVYRHYQRRDIAHREVDLDGMSLEKSNIVMTGPSGCGKTEIARTIAKILQVPIYTADATKLTQAGYVGDDVDTLLQGLLEKANWNVERAQWGIIVIDEIDKIARKSGARGAGYRDVSGEGVQQALLKLIEGGSITVAKGKGVKMIDTSQQASVTIDTTNILFIAMGSFDGIQDVVNDRINQSVRLGFGGSQRKEITSAEVYSKLDEDDLLTFGIIPELAGRLPIQTGVLALTEEQLVHILTKPKGAIVKQMQFLYKQDNVDLTFEEGALKAIARKAIQRKTGARALRGIISKLLLPYDLEVPGSDISAIHITEEYVEGKGQPTITRRPHPILVEA